MPMQPTRYEHELDEMRAQRDELLAALKAIIPIASRMQAACESGETLCYDNDFDAADAKAYLSDIARAEAAIAKAEGQ